MRMWRRPAVPSRRVNSSDVALLRISPSTDAKTQSGTSSPFSKYRSRWSPRSSSNVVASCVDMSTRRRFRFRGGHAPAVYCTFAVTDAVPLILNVHVLVLLPPLEQAPDQIASRPFETLSVIDVPIVNDALPELPTAMLIPDGLEVTRSPLLPVAVTVSAAV